jgi:hypothetical protein
MAAFVRLHAVQGRFGFESRYLQDPKRDDGQMFEVEMSNSEKSKKHRNHTI